MLGEARMIRQLVEMKRAQLESVTHEITGREGGREEKEEQREGGERGTGGAGREKERVQYVY